MFSGKTLLITGGTGTFGNAVLKRFLDTDIGEIRIFSRDEKKQFEMRQAYPKGSVKYYIGDVRNLDSLMEALSGVDFVFHAAALKQVPSCEFYPIEALRTNTLGADNLFTAAIANKVKRVVTLSTDKAVQPINAMGMSKALMEKVMVARSVAAAEKGTVLCGTRYGNVMGSRGSVLPLFIEQIRAKKALTVTDPQMTRFMMSIEDAVELVLYAFQHAKPGELFVQKAPAARIGDAAEAMRQLFKSHSHVQHSPIQVIGTRLGEKRYETLLTREELARAEDLKNYFRVRSEVQDLDYDKFFFEGSDMSQLADYTSDSTQILTVPELVSLLKGLDFVQAALNQ
ncbi:MAG: polysaccharide biosynthesis protein [Oligoflexia bacterium]|nr:polysaccharide biosynthesis protein [Oligoflexia bacterium]